MRRREFIERCAAAAVATAMTGCASLVARAVTPVNGRIELSPLQYPELTQQGGSLKLRPAGSQELVYVIVLPNGDIAALSPICTHLACTVEIQGPRLVCPCHGSTYDRDGTVLQGPATRPLARYQVDRASDGTISIDLTRRS